ncbi:MAG: diguanylate cyclase [Tardiphaga sp.]|nr:diguanylate cyclase [Tardiphaga sp.]
MTAASSIIRSPTTGDFDAVDGEVLAEAQARRRQRRRRALAFAAAFHVVNVVLLSVFAIAGTIAAATVGSFASCATLSIAVFWALSESGVSDDWNDQSFAMPYAAAILALLLTFIAIVPQVAVVFLCALLLVAQAAGMRASPRQGIIIWAVITTGVVLLFWLANVPLAVPFATPLERFGTLLTFSLTIGRITFIGVFASAMRDALYHRRIELEAAYKRIEELAELDELTGSYNRRCILRMLDEEILRTQRNASPCTVALIDLDWFKRINDTFGHPTGDEVLRTFAIAMFANIRSIDRFGRYGGEEFLLVLPDTPHDTAVQLLDRLRAIVATLDWSAFSDGLSVTISAGVATFEPDELPDTLLARADSALYAAKALGRNRVASA